MTWTDITASMSNTTNRNTSRFVLLSRVTYAGPDAVYTNLQPAIRSEAETGRGGAFYLTEGDPITLHTLGEELA